MARTNYIPDDDDGKASQMERFRDTIGSYATTLGLDPGEVTGQAEDATWFRYVLNRTLAMRDSGSQWVAYKNNLLTGTGSATSPVTPPLPAPIPTEAPPGILTRFRNLVSRVKSSSNYTEAIGEALDIIGPDAGEPDPNTVTPLISLDTLGGTVEVIWNKGQMEAVEIQKDTGSGWQFLAIDTRPNYIDTTPFPTPPAMWKYRAIYTKDSQRTGQWSNVAEISVGG